MKEIKRKNGSVRFVAPANEGSVHRKKLMTEDYVLLRFSTSEPVEFERGDYIDISGDHYEIVDLNYPSFNSSVAAYEYELRFDAYYWKWKNKILFYDRQGNKEASWSLTRTPDAHMSVVVSNILGLGYSYNEKAYKYHIDESVDMSAKPITYNNTNIIDALTRIAETWDSEWWVEDNVIHLGKCEYPNDAVLELNGNVQSMSRSESNDNFATRIYAFGSTRNLPANYRENESVVVNGVVQKRLMLPSGINSIDAYENMSQEDAVEAVVVFDDVYPRRVGTMSAVVSVPKFDTVENEDGSTTEVEWKAYRFKDEDLKFSKEYHIPGQELRIVFTGGALNGMDFEVLFNPLGEEDESRDEAQLWEIKRNETYTLSLPNDSMKPIDGDTYILYGFNTKFVSEQMLPAAEQELKERAIEYVRKSKEDPSVYDCVLNVVEATTSESGLKVGDRVKLINPAFFPAGRESRIYGFEKQLDGSGVKYTVGDSAKYSRLAQVEQEIKEIVYQGNAYSGGGSGVYVIGTNDSTRQTDRNVFSSVRTLKEIENKALSRLYSDVASGHIAFNEGFTAYKFATFYKGIVKDYISSESFIPGFAGEGMKIWNEDGKWTAEFDNVVVRQAMTIYELIISKIRAVNGGLIISPSNGRIKSVSKTTGSPAYYELGVEDDMTFVAGDLVRCQVFSSNNLKSYWVEVKSVQGDKIRCLVSDFGTAVPAIGDDLVQMGSKTNTARQGALYLTASEDGKPRIQVLDGINSTNLAGKNKAILGCLDGITDTNFPAGSQPKGYGLYSDNAYLRGDFILKNGNSVETELSAVPGKITLAVGDVQIGIKNILLKSNVSATGNGYPIKTYYYSEPLIEGETYTIVYKGKYNGTNTNGYLGIWINDGYNQLTQLQIKSDTPIIKSHTFKYSKAVNNTNIRIGAYHAPSGNEGTSTIEWIILVKGNKAPMEWIASPKDVEADIKKAKEDASNAQTAATNAQTSANSANSLLTDIASDNKLTAVEKQETKKEWDAIVSEYTKNLAQATKFGVSGTAYTNAYNALKTYITPLLSNLATTSNITGATFRTTFKTYYDARTDLLNAVSGKAKELADKAQEEIVKVKEDATNAQTAATKAQTSANTANSLLADIANDNKLTAVEKQETMREWTAIFSEYSKNLAQGTKFGVSSTAYTTAYNALNTYITPLLSNLATTTNITGSTFRTTFKAYYDARTDLLNAVSVKAKELADKAQAEAEKVRGEYKAEVKVLKDEIALTATKKELGDLTNRVSAAEISLKPDKINLTVSDQISTKIKSEVLDKIGTQLLPNNWTLGTGSNEFYSQNGTTIENHRVYGKNHLNNTVVLWECRPSGNADGDGGWNSSPVTIDKTKAYRFSVFIKKSDANGSYYFGCGHGSVCTLNTTTLHGNPYFYSASGIPVYNRWYLFIGYVYPYGLSGLTHNGEIWDCETGQRTGSGLASFNWANTTSTYHRCYHFYNSTTATRQWMWQPRIDLIDGNEPSVSSLIGFNSEKIKAGIGISANKITVFGKELSLAGQVTFSSFDSSTQNTINGKATTQDVTNAKNSAISTAAGDATTKANNAKTAAATDATNKANNAKTEAISAAASDATTKANNAKTAAITDARNNVAQKLGYTNFADMEAKAIAGQTIINGGYIRTSLINVDALVAKKISGATGTLGTLSMNAGGHIDLPPSFTSNRTGKLDANGLSMVYQGSRSQSIEWYSGMGTFAGNITCDSTGNLNLLSSFGIKIQSDVGGGKIRVGTTSFDDVYIGNALGKVYFSGATIDNISKATMIGQVSYAYVTQYLSANTVYEVNTDVSLYIITGAGNENTGIYKIMGANGSSPINGSVFRIVNACSKKINLRTVRMHTDSNIRNQSTSVNDFYLYAYTSATLVYYGGYWYIHTDHGQ